MVRRRTTKERNRCHTISGLPDDALSLLLQVPNFDDLQHYSSQNELSSPETASDQPKNEKKHKKMKKSRQYRTYSPPHLHSNKDDLIEDIKAKEDHNKRMNDYEGLKVPSRNNLTHSKVQKVASFKKRTQSESIEKISMIENKENKRSSTRSDPKISDKISNEYNIVLLGDLNVGKTALAVRFVTRRYLHEYDPTLERTYEKPIHCNGETCMIRLWDTVNKQWDNFVEQVDGFAVMFSVTSSQSLNNAQNIIDSIRSSKNPLMNAIPILLIGNKAELQQARKVEREDCEQFAITNGVIFKECSVACMNNVDSIIKSLVKRIQATQRYQNGRTNHSDGNQKQNLLRKPSNASRKTLMKNFLSKKKEKS